jgi:hypothetical protein
VNQPHNPTAPVRDNAAWDQLESAFFNPERIAASRSRNVHRLRAMSFTGTHAEPTITLTPAQEAAEDAWVHSGMFFTPEENPEDYADLVAERESLNAYLSDGPAAQAGLYVRGLPSAAIMSLTDMARAAGMHAEPSAAVVRHLRAVK